MFATAVGSGKHNKGQFRKQEKSQVMSDSEDDWFEKDIDEFVVQAQPSNVEIIEATDADTAEPINAVYADAGLLLPNLYNLLSHVHCTKFL